MESNGYTIVYYQWGLITGDAVWLEGDQVLADQFIAISNDYPDLIATIEPVIVEFDDLKR